jgi:predicted ester cyclase
VSVIENKVLVRKIYEHLNRGEMEAYANCCAPGFIEHFTDRDLSIEQVHQFDADFGKAFSLIGVSIDSIIAEADKIAVLVTWKMKHTGEYLGKPPTGENVYMTNANVFRIADDKIAESWNVMDMLFLQRISSKHKPGL